MPSGWDTQLAKARGEYLVCAELCARGYVATPFAGNVPYIDILAGSRDGRLLAVQVKSVTKRRWQFDMLGFLDISFEDDGCQVLGREKPTPYPGLVVVLAALASSEFPKTRFFVAPWEDFRDRQVHLHHEWVTGLRHCDTHGGYFRKKASSHTLFTMDQVPQRWEDNWSAVL